MSRVEHYGCGYSRFAPGCDDPECLVHRLEVATMRGWDVAALQVRLDALVEHALTEVLETPAERRDRSRLE